MCQIELENTLIHIFADESGNTGANYADPDQPFYVLAGWIVKNDQLESVRGVLIDWESRFGSSAEVKSKNILKRSNGLKQISAVMKEIIRIGSFPIYCIQEKRFLLCAMIVEGFTFPRRKSSVSKKFWSSENARIHLANKLYDLLSDELLLRFSSAFQKSDRNTLTCFCNELIGNILDNDIGRLFSSASIPEVVDFFCCGEARDNSSNALVFYSFISMLESFSLEFGIEKWNLIHDETASFQNYYKVLAARISNIHLDSFETDNGVPVLLGKYSRWKSFSFASSDSEPIVRAADLLSGAINKVLKVANAKEEMDAQLVESARYFLEPMFNRNKCYPKLYLHTISNNFWRKIALRCGVIS